MLLITQKRLNMAIGKLIFISLVVSASLYAYTAKRSCEKIAIIEYTYHTKEELEKKYTLYKKWSDEDIARSLRDLKEYQDLASSNVRMEDAKCHLDNRENVGRVLKKDHKYTDEMLKALQDSAKK